MRKPTICICENKDADQLRGNREADQRPFVFATRIVQLLYFLNPKFQASSQLPCLYSSVCVEPARKPHCWFSHVAAHLGISDRSHLFMTNNSFFILVLLSLQTYKLQCSKEYKSNISLQITTLRCLTVS